MVNPLQQLREGIARVESGGNYNALGPDVPRQSGIDRAYGKYQVMGANIPGWTKQALGRKMSPQEFLRSPEAQEAVFRDQMTRNLQKYGTLEDAASVWFTGRPYAQARQAGARDVNMGVDQYVRQTVGRGGGMQGALAYTDAPERPDFPSLKAGYTQTAQAQPEELTPEDFLEGKHLQQTAPQQTQPQVAPQKTYEYTPEDFLEGKHLEPGAAPVGSVTVGSLEEPPTKIAAEAEPEWGFGRSMARGAVSGLTGFIPSTTIAGRPIGPADLSKAGATVRAGYEALTGQAPEGFMARRKAITKELEGARRKYEQENAMPAQIATTLGAAAGTLAPMGVAGRAAGAGLRLAGRMVPVMAPALESVGGFLGGQGTALKGIPSATAEGALYGMGESALTQQLVPEEERGLKSVLYGGAGGAAVGGIFSPLARTLGKSFQHEIPKDRLDLVNMAKDKFGLDVHLGQVSSDPEVKHLYKEIVSPKKQMKQVDNWNKKVSEEVGLSGKPMTDENIQEAKRHWGTEIADSVKSKLALADTQMYNNLFNYEKELFAGLPKNDPLRAKFQEFAQELLADITPTGEIKGEVLQGFLRNQGRIDRLFTNVNDPLFKKVGHDMRDFILDTLERSDKPAADALREARDKYKKLAAIDEIVAGSDVGKISPHKLKAAVRARKIGQDPAKPDALKQLADIGVHLPELSPNGALQTANRPFSWRSAGEAAAALAGPVASMAGFPIGYGNLVSFALMGDLAKRTAQSQIMGSNVLNRAAQSGFYQPAVNAFGNVLLGTGGAFGSGVGGMERQK